MNAATEIAWAFVDSFGHAHSKSSCSLLTAAGLDFEALDDEALETPRCPDCAGGEKFTVPASFVSSKVDTDTGAVERAGGCGEGASGPHGRGSRFVGDAADMTITPPPAPVGDNKFGGNCSKCGAKMAPYTGKRRKTATRWMVDHIGECP